MNELLSEEMVSDKEIIESLAKMEKMPLKLFVLIVCKFDNTDPTKTNTLNFSKKELFSVFEIEENKKDSWIACTFGKLQKQSVILKIEGVKEEYRNVVPIPFVRWSENSDEIIIRFDKSFIPYVPTVKKLIASGNIFDVISLKKKYSASIFKRLSVEVGQYDDGKVSHSVTIDVEELRKITGTENEYLRFDHFETWVIKNSVTEINERTTLNVSYSKIKVGRSIKSIEFYIKKKQN